MSRGIKNRQLSPLGFETSTSIVTGGLVLRCKLTRHTHTTLTFYSDNFSDLSSTATGPQVMLR